LVLDVILKGLEGNIYTNVTKSTKSQPWPEESRI
jgi:hypothetical protein